MKTEHRNYFDRQMMTSASEVFSSRTENAPANLAKQCINRLLTRIDRLEYLIDVDAPAIVVRNERRMVQSAVRELVSLGASLSRDGASDPLVAAIWDGALAKLLGPEAGLMPAQ